MDKIIFQNYHKHSYWTNIKVSDSTTSLEEYCKRAKELGHGIISSVEHGWQGHYIECHQLAEKYGLKFLFGTEAYWVKDRLSVDEAGHKDGSNCHICLLAMNENGRQAINDILSQAAIDGYYRQSRIDLPLIMSLPAKDVIVTTACVAGWKYDDIEDIYLKMFQHFGNNFYLEVQYHNTEVQKELNKRILKLHDKYNFQIIMGCDSHYIDEKGKNDRDEFIKSKGMDYPDEDGWYMDYPDGETAYNRFAEQCVLSHDEIMEAINNTNVFLNVEEYDCPIFNHDIKMPTLYPNLSQEEKDALFENIIWDEWDKYKVEVPMEKWEHYKEEIRNEVDIVKTTFHSDYFLLDYNIAKLGKEKGGVLTLTSRGCFTKDAIISTKTGLKNINEVQIGDEVINKDGKWASVSNTMSYDIEEELLELIYDGCNKKKFVSRCTKDHKILIYNKDTKQTIWKQAQDIIPLKDYMCCPKIKIESNNHKDYIDLNEYNIFGFKYDDNYIYETIANIGVPYAYSPSEVARVLHTGKSVIENYVNGKMDHFVARNGVTEKDVLTYTGFNSTEEYREYIRNKKLKKINRFIPNDYIMGQFIGMMYGDGFNIKNRSYIGLAINTTTNKNIINRKIFETIAERINVPISENKSKIKNLSQLFIKCKVFKEYISRELFISDKQKIKQFNSKFFDESLEIRKGIQNGLFITDGCISNYRVSFDNTSLSLINAFRILSNSINENIYTLYVRDEHVDKRGYLNKESYKASRCKRFVLEDENYWYVPVRQVKNLGIQNTTVYDLTVPDTNSFMLDNAIVHNSAPSFFITKLLGFTSIDRIAAKVHMYPERFMSPTRILETHSLADIDMNVAKQEPFWEAQEELLGYEHSKQMIAFQQLKPPAAWKMYAKSQNIDFETANTVSGFIKKWQKAVAHAEEDEKDTIDIMDYIPKEYQEIYEKSVDYLGVISAVTPHACGSLIYQGDIRKEIGYIYVKSQSNDGMICCCMDGKWAEKYGFLKNDWLKVNVVEVIYDIFKRIGIEPIPSNELIKICTPENKVWDIYKNQCTKGINQVEGEGTASRAAKYKPNNISELTAFVAAIRPGFKTMYKKFESREPFNYGVKSFDNLIATDEMPDSFVLYQEQVMATLHYAGIPMSECYGIIKSIAKKRVEEVYKYKEIFMDNFSKALVNNENMTKEQADSMTDNIWKIIEANASYSFNCISGDERLQGETITIKEMYLNNTFAKAFSLNEDRIIRQNDIINIYPMGVKKTYKVTTELGCCIKCTIDHKFPTPNGEIRLSELSIGDELYKRWDKIDNTYTTILDKIINIEYSGEQEVFDIEMKHPYHTFVMEDGLVVCNCSHSYSVALDSLYGSYLKTYYPLEFYETYLNILNKKGDKDRLNAFKQEAEHYFNIAFPPFRYKQDNRSIILDKEHNAINNALSSIKGYSDIIAEALYQCSIEANDDFISVLKWLDDHSIKSAKIIPLIKIGYFNEYGNENSLLKFIEFWDLFKQGDAKSLNKEKVTEEISRYIDKYATDKNKDGSEAKAWKITDCISLLNDLYNDCLWIEEPTYSERMSWQEKILGYIELTTNKPEDTKKVLILDIKPLIGQYSEEPWCYKIETRSIGTGRTASLNIDKKTWQRLGSLEKMDIIEVTKINKNKSGYWYIYDYKKLYQK